MTPNKIQAVRFARQIELEELASRIGSSARELSAIEGNEREISVGLALKIARALGKSVEFLFGDEETNDEPSELVDESVRREETEIRRAPQVVAAPKPTRRKRAKKNGESEETKVEETPKIKPYTPLVSRDAIDETATTDRLEERVAPLLETSAPYQASPKRKARRVYAPRSSAVFSSPESKVAREEGLAASPNDLVDPTLGRPIRYFDLFCGIGGFRYAVQNVLPQMGREGWCVLSCDFDKPAQRSYAANFGETPYGDVETLPSEKIPDFDLLFAGFPCQSFSIIGLRKGFADETKGSLFFQVARILRDKRPRAFVLENVRQLTTHDGGRTFEIVLRVLQDELGYCVDWRILNALDCGVPQKRERVVVVGSDEPFEMEWPAATTNGKTLVDVLEKKENVDPKYFASPEIVRKRREAHTSNFKPAIWHENKSGNISSYPYSCALRAGASYNYLLVDGERRLTSRELLRLQGFPDSFKIVVSDSQLRKQAGNAAPVCLIERALERFLPLTFKTLK